MANENSIQGILKMQQLNKKIPAVNLIKKDPILAATLSKMVTPRIKTLVDTSGDSGYTNINMQELQTVVEDTSRNIDDYQSILQLFPDIELAAQILVSSIQSPKDMTTSEIIYSNESSFLPPDVVGSLMAKVKEQDTKHYKIKEELSTILREVLFESGSYVKAILPESSIDQLINSNSKVNLSKTIGLESLSAYLRADGSVKNIGVLGSVQSQKTQNTNVAFELFKEYKGTKDYENNIQLLTDSGVETMKSFKVHVTDNPALFRMPSIVSRVRQEKLSKIYQENDTHTMSFESMQPQLSANQIYSLIYKDKPSGTKEMQRVRTQAELARKTIGKPLILKLPSECVIPVFVPGDEKKHIGYFVLLDQEGNPINKKNNRSYFNDLQSKLNTQNTLSSQLISKSKTILGDTCSKLTTDQATRIYADIVERDIVQRLKTGVYGRTLEVGQSQEVYRLMLARALSNQLTQMLYVPSELVTYFAYKFNDNGTGKSLLEDQKILNSLRSITMFARIMASIKNSIGRTEVRLKLDERDPDPSKTIEMTMHEIAKTRQNAFPLGLNSPVDLVNWIQRSGFEFTFEGHPRIPDMSVNFSEKASSHPKPDTDLDEELKKRSIQALGLSPETVDNGFQAEFATTAVQNNLLLSKRVIQIQNEITPQLTDYLKKMLKNDGDAIYEIKSLIEAKLPDIKEALQAKVLADKQMLTSDKEIVEFCFMSFIDSIKVSLPQPNSITLENQMESFDKYSEALDKVIGAYISAEILNDSAVGELTNNVDMIKEMIKSHYLRKWLANNNILPELTELTTINEKDNAAIDLLDMQKSHLTALLKTNLHLLTTIKGDELTDTPIPQEEVESPGGSEESEEDSTAEDEGSDDEFGVDEQEEPQEEEDKEEDTEEESKNKNKDDTGEQF